MKNKCKKNIWYRILHWYILGEYHCDKCPYSWEERTSYEYDEWEVGCYIKGDIHGTCRLIPPFRWIIGSLRKRKAEYYYNHQYDGIEEHYEQWEAANEKIEELLANFLKGYDLCWKDSKGEYHPINKEEHIRYDGWRVRCDYEDFYREQEKNKILIKTRGKRLWYGLGIRLKILSSRMSASKGVTTMLNELKPKFCKGFECKNCYRYLQCWCCKKAD